MGSERFSISRRTFLRAGAAAALVDFRHSWFGTNIRVVSGAGWLTVLHGDIPAFNVSESGFSGRPRIWKRQHGETLSFGIEGARFPGSSVLAEFVCDLFPSSKGLNARLLFEPLNLSFEGLARDWLGGHGLSSTLQRSIDFTSHDDNRITILPGDVWLAADGSAQFNGGASIRLYSENAPIRASRAELSSIKPVDLDNARSRSSKLTLSRGSECWNLQLPAGNWKIAKSDRLFDRASLVLDEDDKGNLTHRVTFSRSKFQGSVEVQLGSPAAVPAVSIKDLRYSIDSAQKRCVLEASLQDSLVFRGDKIGLKLNNPKGRPALLAIRAETQSSSCTIVGDASLDLPEFENVFLDSPDTWNVRIDDASSDDPPLKDIDARLIAARDAYSLEGALRLRIVRPWDAVDLPLTITNVQITFDGMLLKLIDRNKISLLIVDLPPQSLLEPAVPNSNPSGGDDVPAPATPQYSRISAPSRLSFVFLTPDNSQCLLTPSSLLRWADYRLHVAPSLVDPTQVPPGTPVPELSTQIIAPAGISLSPDQNHAFFASEDARGDGHVFQLWTARLSRRASPGEFSNGGSEFPVIDALRPSLFSLGTRPLLDPPANVEYGYSKRDYAIISGHLERTAADAKHLLVSNRGAWIDVKESWPVDAANSSSFHTRIAGSLEQLEEITFEGVLVPTGHRVTVVQSAERQWCRDKTSSLLIARFVKRYKIIYHERTMDYSFLRGKFIAQGTEQLPFDSVTLLGSETPFLDFKQAENFSDLSGGPSTTYWAWIDPAGETPFVPYEFPIECVDRSGIAHRTTAQMLVAAAFFVYDDQTGHTDYAKQIVEKFKQPPVIVGTTPVTVDTTLRFKGSRIAYSSEIRRGEASFPTNEFRWVPKLVPDLSAAKSASAAPWFPVMVSTSLTLEQSAAFSQPQALPPPAVFEYSRVYKAEPFDYMSGSPKKNKAEIILGLSPTANTNPSPLKFNGQLGGGLALPSTGIQWLARKGGSIFQSVNRSASQAEAALDNVANGLFAISDVFESASEVASLLGAVSLSSLLQDVTDATAQAAAVPKLASQQLHTLEQEVIDDVRGYLSKLLGYEQSIVAQANSILGQLQSIRDTIAGSVGLIASLGRVLLREGSPDDVSALKGKILYKTPAGDADLVGNLIPKLGESIASRIQEATSLPLDATVKSQSGALVPKPVLPTAFQFRDYIANQLIASAATDAAPFLDLVEQAIADAQETTSNVLEQALSQANRITDDFTSFFLFQFADAIDGLTALVNGSIDADALFRIADSVQTISQLISQVPQWKSQWATFRAGLTQQLTDAPTKIADALLNGSTPYQALTAVICPPSGQQPCGPTPLPVPVVKALSQALGSEIAPLFTSTNIQTAISDASKKLDSFFDSFESSLGNAIDALINSEEFEGILNDLELIIELLHVPRQVSVSYDYDVPLQSSGVFLAERNGRQARLSLHSNVTLNLNGQPPQYDITVAVSSFELMLLPAAPFIRIGFDKVAFDSKNGQKPTISCPIGKGNIEFVGPLDLVAELASALGLGDVLIAQLLGSGVLVGANIPLPSIEVGAFAMTGLAISIAVHLDFTGQPMRMLFGFANPGQHFIVTYLFLGGGGFIDLEFTPADMSTMSINGALELGAMLALNFGVANGEVHAFAGFNMQRSQGLFLLSGYYRCGGELNVLGLISASVEFSMALTYEDRSGHAWLSGECDLVIDVHVFLFSTSVSLRMHHDFSNSSGS